MVHQNEPLGSRCPRTAQEWGAGAIALSCRDDQQFFHVLSAPAVTSTPLVKGLALPP